MSDVGDTIWVWQSEDSPGRWSTISAMIPGLNAHGPLLSRQKNSIDVLAPLARAHGRGLGQRIRLVRFELAQVEEEHVPD